jgi:hypothetical protein
MSFIVTVPEGGCGAGAGDGEGVGEGATARAGVARPGVAEAGVADGGADDELGEPGPDDPDDVVGSAGSPMAAGADCCPGAVGPDGESGYAAPPSATGAEPVPADGPAPPWRTAYSKNAATTMSATPATVASALPPPPLRTDPVAPICARTARVPKLNFSTLLVRPRLSRDYPTVTRKWLPAVIKMNVTL